MDLTTIKIATMMSLSSMADSNQTTHSSSNQLAILPPHSHGGQCMRSGSRCGWWVLREHKKITPRKITYEEFKQRQK
jgi:hypothetical protein